MNFFDDYIIMCLLISIFIPAILIIIMSLYRFKGYLAYKLLKRRFDRLPSTATCTICLESTKDGGLSDVYRLPCRHWFHKVCLRKWIRYNNNCPNCRQVVSDEDGQRLDPVPRILIDFDAIEQRRNEVIRERRQPQNYLPRTWTRLRTARVQMLF